MDRPKGEFSGRKAPSLPPINLPNPYPKLPQSHFRLRSRIRMTPNTLRC